MSITDLIEQFTIQGAYHIKVWKNHPYMCETLARGSDFECECFDIDGRVLERNITYMYVMDGVLNIELEEPEEEVE